MTIDELIAFSKLLKEYKQMRKAIEDIKTEIDEQYDRVHPYDISCAEGLEMALEIIDRHISGEEQT